MTTLLEKRPAVDSPPGKPATQPPSPSIGPKLANRPLRAARRDPRSVHPRIVGAPPPPGDANDPPPPDVPWPSPEYPAERQAALVQQVFFPSAMATALGLEGQVGALGYRLFLDRLRQDAGDPTDPIEIMLLEQLAMCHLRAADLQGQAGQVQGLEAIRLYNETAARLMAELRKTALALKLYRTPAPGRNGRGGRAAGPGPPDGV